MKRTSPVVKSILFKTKGTTNHIHFKGKLERILCQKDLETTFASFWVALTNGTKLEKNRKDGFTDAYGHLFGWEPILYPKAWLTLGLGSRNKV